MYRKLVKSALKKMKEKLEKEEGMTPSFTKTSERLAILLQENYKVSYGDRSLRDVSKGLIKIKQVEVLKALCNFLEYDTYESFIKDNSEGKNTTSFLKGIFKNKKVILGLLTVVIFLFCISMFTVKKQRWMIWKANHYEEVSFNPKKYGIGQLKLYKEERILYFKKIDGTCEYEYFNTKGEVKVWYGKNYKGNLELFTSVGLHPETGKTLKPITTYMLRKYICSGYEKKLKTN